MIRRLRTSLWISLAALLAAWRPALAHDGDPHEIGVWWQAWSLEPAVIALLAFTLLLYARGWHSMKKRTGRIDKARTWAFAGGMTALIVALLSPVDALAGQLFWVHMLQHNLLILVAAPLLVIAYPLPPILLGLPENARRKIGKGWAGAPWLRRLWGFFNRPLAAWIINTFLLWGWHMPVFYQASVENDTIHALQHFSFLGGALLFWWVALHTFATRSQHRGAGILYLFTTALHSGLLGALLTFSTQLWYPVYSGRSEAWGITALADQQLAGTIMWVPNGMIYLLAALWMMKAWLDDMETRDQRAVEKKTLNGSGLGKRPHAK